MGALIILGAVLLLVVRYIIHRRQRGEEDDEELAESIEKLKKELQQSADTIIKRLGSHVTKLEGLLREADDRRVQLETRVADAQRLEWALQTRVEELERRLNDLGQMSPTARQMPAASLPQQIAGGVGIRAAMQPMEAQRTDGEAVAAVLHQSVLREQMRGTAQPPMNPAPMTSPSASAAGLQRTHTVPATPLPVGGVPRTAAHRQTQSVPAQPAPPVPPMEEPEEEVQEDEAIIKARALLRAGRTIEQVARETGVEIGALRLMKQMTQKD